MANVLGSKPMSSHDQWRDRLASAIHNKNIKVTLLSTELGLHRDYVSNVISGKAKPNTDRVAEICDKLGVSLSYILTGDGEEKNGENGSESVTELQSDALDSLRHLVKNGEWNTI